MPPDFDIRTDPTLRKDDVERILRGAEGPLSVMPVIRFLALQWILQMQDWLPLYKQHLPSVQEILWRACRQHLELLAPFIKANAGAVNSTKATKRLSGEFQLGSLSPFYNAGQKMLCDDDDRSLLRIANSILREGASSASLLPALKRLKQTVLEWQSSVPSPQSEEQRDILEWLDRWDEQTMRPYLRDVALQLMLLFPEYIDRIALSVLNIIPAEELKEIQIDWGDCINQETVEAFWRAQGVCFNLPELQQGIAKILRQLGDIECRIGRPGSDPHIILRGKLATIGGSDEIEAFYYSTLYAFMMTRPEAFNYRTHPIFDQAFSLDKSDKLMRTTRMLQTCAQSSMKNAVRYSCIKNLVGEQPDEKAALKILAHRMQIFRGLRLTGATTTNFAVLRYLRRDTSMLSFLDRLAEAEEQQIKERHKKPPISNATVEVFYPTSGLN